MMRSKNTMTPFMIDVPQNVLDDLKGRLALTRWPDEIVGSSCDYGVNLEYLKGLSRYWENE